jgi:transcriptional regulator with XRE-family HTH domain
MRNDKTTLTKKLGKRIAGLRASKKLSQEQFAARVGISRGYLSDLERGAREISVATLASLCKATRTSSNDLLGF